VESADLFSGRVRPPVRAWYGFVSNLQTREHGATITQRLAVVRLPRAGVLYGPLVGSLVVGFTGLFFAFMHGWLGFLAIRPFLLFGTISYSLYIVYQNCGYVMLRELTDADMAWPAAGF